MVYRESNICLSSTNSFFLTFFHFISFIFQSKSTSPQNLMEVSSFFLKISLLLYRGM